LLITGLPEKLAVPTTLAKPIVKFTVANPEAFKAGANSIGGNNTSANPRVEIVATSLTATPPAVPPYSVEPLGSKGACQLVFEKPLPEGTYTVNVSYQAGGVTDRKTLALSAYSIASAQTVQRTLDTVKPRFGERFTVQTLFPYDIAPLKENLVWSCSLGFDQREETPFAETFRSPLIPAIARKATLELVWKHPQTGERVVLATRTMDTEQRPPVFYGQAEIDLPPPQKGRKSVLKPDETEFVIRGLALNYAVPIDADERQTPAQVVKAELGDVAITDIGIDLTDTRTGLAIIFTDVCCGKNPYDPKAPYKADYSTVQSSGTFENGSFLITVRLKKIPKFTNDKRERMMTGLLVVKIVAKLTNRKAGKSVTEQLMMPVPVRLFVQ
jgi:hypothetical protein